MSKRILLKGLRLGLSIGFVSGVIYYLFFMIYMISSNLSNIKYDFTPNLLFYIIIYIIIYSSITALVWGLTGTVFGSIFLISRKFHKNKAIHIHILFCALFCLLAAILVSLSAWIEIQQLSLITGPSFAPDIARIGIRILWYMVVVPSVLYAIEGFFVSFYMCSEFDVILFSSEFLTQKDALLVVP
jgi:hypothetical protein